LQFAVVVAVSVGFAASLAVDKTLAIQKRMFVAFVAGISCGHLVDPPLPADATQFAPPPVYTRWWAMVEECSGLTGSLDNVQWYSAPEQLFDPNNSGEPVEGYWSAATNRIVLSSNDTIDGSTVRHEMLHALTRSGAHTRSQFLRNCGGVVPCPTKCVQEAGAPVTPDAGTPRIAPSELEVTSAISPQTPGFDTDDGLATFTVSARNPFPYPVVVLLSAIGGGIATTYRYDMIREAGGNVSSADFAYDIGGTYFAAGETKRDVFDFILVPISTPSFGAVPGTGTGGIALPPGNYVFRGDYGGQFAPDLNVVLSP
jgi:hypothetical protein